MIKISFGITPLVHLVKMDLKRINIMLDVLSLVPGNSESDCCLISICGEERQKNTL